MATRSKKKPRRRDTAPAAVAPAKRLERRVDEGKLDPRAGARERRPPRFEVRNGVPRPEPVWAPFPLSEIAMLVGIVIFVFGLLTGGDAQGATLIGIGALVLTVAVAELCLREHFAGFRSHSLLLALLPVVALHTFGYFVIRGFYRGPLAIFIDLALFGALALLLHGRFRSAHAKARAAHAR